VLISRLDIEVPPREMPMSVLAFWEGAWCGCGGFARLRFGGGVVGGCARIGFDWFQCVRHQMLIEDGDFMPL
jgi:hypothetical protein